MVHIDYFYLGAKEDDTLPLLAMLDETSERMFSLTMPCKGVEHQYCVAAVVKLMRCLGLQDAVIKSDTERSLVALRRGVQDQLPGVGFEGSGSNFEELLGRSLWLQDPCTTSCALLVG